MKEKVASFIIVNLLFSLSHMPLFSQTTSDSLNKKRIIWTASALGIGYGTSTYLLNETWYKNYPRSSFHFFDDWGEWNNMDKIGHIYSSQFQSIYAYNLYKWTGMNDKKSIIYGSLTSLLFQSTIEVLDGFSTQWGFSVYDFSANVLGVSLFAAQQATWGKQNILFKVSGGYRSYDIPVNGVPIFGINDRADDLFGSSLPSRFLKDYNAQTYWVSLNIKELTQSRKWPSWLNLSLGYGTENLFGGRTNSWTENGVEYYVDHNLYPRYQQFYFSPDIDLSRIPVKSKFVKTILGILNIFKVPLPALEVNSLGDVHFHALKF